MRLVDIFASASPSKLQSHQQWSSKELESVLGGKGTLGVRFEHSLDRHSHWPTVLANAYQIGRPEAVLNAQRRALPKQACRCLILCFEGLASQPAEMRLPPAPDMNALVLPS